MPTPYSFVQDTGNGVTKQFAIPFPYIAREDVHAYLDGVETTAFTWINASMIEFTVTPGNNVIVERRRRTPIDQLVVNMSNGSTLTEADMDAAHLQTLYAQQELDDVKNYAVILTSDGTMDAQGKRIKNVGTPTQTTDAATKGYVDAAYAASPGGHAIAAHNDIEVTATPEAGALLVGNDSATSKWDKQAIGATGQVLEVDLALPKRVKWAQGLRNLLTTAGDLIVATAAGVGARLGVGGKGALLVGAPGQAEKMAWVAAGSNNQVLIADSTQAAGLKWGALPAGSVTSSSIDTTPSGRKDIRLLLGEKYFTLEDFGGAGDNSTDNTTPLNNCVAAMAAAGTRVIRLRAGIYKFNSKPNDFTTGVILLGQGMSQTSFMRAYNGASNDEGFLTWSGSGSNGGGLAHMMVQTADGTTGGTMLKFYTTSNDVAGYHWMEQVVCTFNGTGYYYRCLLVDGDGNQTVGSQGLRDFFCDRAFLFKPASGQESARFINATNMIVYGMWASGNVVITGGGSTYRNTNYARWDGDCLAQLFVSESIYVSCTGIVSTLNFSTNSNTCMFTGVVTTSSGGVSNSGTNNRYLAPGYGT